MNQDISLSFQLSSRFSIVYSINSKDLDGFDNMSMGIIQNIVFEL